MSSKEGPLPALRDETSSLRAAGFEWLPVVAGLLVLYVPSFYKLGTTLWQEDGYAHGPIILMVLAWLVWEKRQVLLVPALQRAFLPGLALLILGLLMYILGRSQDVNVLEVGSLIPVFAGVVVAMRGWPALRSFWFMLVFAIYLVPIPGILVDAITGPLKQHVSAVAAQILYMGGYPIARNGVVLTIGQYQLLVADACSGINSMFSLSAIGLLYLHLIRYKSWLHNGLILASLLPIAFCANILRVMFLVLVTYHFGDEAGQGFIHKFSGMVLFVAALIILLLLDTILARVIKSPKLAA